MDWATSAAVSDSFRLLKKKKKKKKKAPRPLPGFGLPSFFFLFFFYHFWPSWRPAARRGTSPFPTGQIKYLFFKKKLGKTRYDSIFAWISWTGREISPKKNERNSVKLGRTQSLNQIFILKKNSVKLGTTRFLLGFHELEGKFRQKKKTKETR